VHYADYLAALNEMRENQAVLAQERDKLEEQLAEANRVIADYKSALWRVTQEALDLFFDQTAVQNRIDMELKISAASRAITQKVEP